jgi:hypothetical protein
LRSAPISRHLTNRCLFCCARHLRTAHSTPLTATISRNSKNSVGRLLLGSAQIHFKKIQPQFTGGHPRGRKLSTQPEKFVLGLGLIASGRRGLSIEEVESLSKCRKAQWQGA